LRCYITVARDTALAEAAESARRWAGGRAFGPLDGVPIALKDNIDVAGLPCTAGTAVFRDRMPASDARVVERLRAHGAVLLGKLNMHEAALGATNDNPAYGRCMNPRRIGYTPGGSSGGSGAAVAAGLCAAALGTDTMGSVRVPASYCGVWGFKPTNGAIPTEGVVPLSRTLDTVGPLARSAADLVIVARAMLDPLPRGFGGAAPSGALEGLRIGVPRQLEEIDVEAPVAAAFAAFRDVLRLAKVDVVPLDIAPWQPRQARRRGLLVSEAEGAAYYERLLGPEFPGLTEELKSSLRFPARAGLGRLVAAYEELEHLRVAVRRAFAEVDLLALPTTPQRAFPHGSAAPENQADCTALANFARTPALSLPLLIDPLPVGVQFMAAPEADLLLLGLAAPLAGVSRSVGDASP
jgi:aspartyl-tRNA(Asn)/glutamyl-tRNA(Gln) amidotransferase subunit A